MRKREFALVGSLEIPARYERVRLVWRKGRALLKFHHDRTAVGKIRRGGKRKRRFAAAIKFESDARLAAKTDDEIAAKNKVSFSFILLLLCS